MVFQTVKKARRDTSNPLVPFNTIKKRRVMDRQTDRASSCQRYGSSVAQLGPSKDEQNDVPFHTDTD